MISATVKPARAAETVARHIEGLILEGSLASYAVAMAGAGPMRQVQERRVRVPPHPPMRIARGDSSHLSRAT